MLEKIKKILQSHKKAYPGAKIVAVTTTRYYQIPEGTSIPVPELLEEWFKKHLYIKHMLFEINLFF